MPIQVHTRNHGAYHVAGPAPVTADAVHHDRAGLTAAAVHVVHDLLIAVMDSGHHDVFGATLAQLPAQTFQFIGAEFSIAIINAHQGAKFREVRREDVGEMHQRAHLFAKFRSVSGVKPAVVAHHRVDQRKHALLLEGLYKIDNDIDLFFRTQESRSDCIERHVQILIGLNIVAHLGSVIVEKILGELRMRRKDCSRHGNGLNFHGRNDWRHDGNRTATETSDVIDQRNLFLWHSGL